MQYTPYPRQYLKTILFVVSKMTLKRAASLKTLPCHVDFFGYFLAFLVLYTIYLKNQSKGSRFQLRARTMGDFKTTFPSFCQYNQMHTHTYTFFFTQENLLICIYYEEGVLYMYKINHKIQSCVQKKFQTLFELYGIQS